MDKKIICRKCNGPHFTIKCTMGKTIDINEKPVNEKPVNEKPVISTNKYIENKPKSENRKYYKVKLSELPIDMTEEELMELLHEWGTVTNLRLLNYNESSVAYIFFATEHMANYFIEAIDRTPFEHILLSATRV
jgi:hypothetical protein